MLQIALIWAMTKNRVIGKDGKLPWRLPGDLALFKKQTLGKAVIMGRRTFDTIKTPLPDRVNIVLTRNRRWQFDNVQAAATFDAAYALAQQATPDHAECMIVGGADIYAMALPYAHRLYLTLVHAELEGDTYFPEFDCGQWHVRSKQHYDKDDKHSHAWSALVLEKDAPPETNPL